jgi:hypothetical protein
MRVDEYQSLRYRTSLVVERWDADAIEWVARLLERPVETIGSLDMQTHRIRAYAAEEHVGNVLLQEGINVMMRRTFLAETASPITAYDNTNARIGVGDGTTPAANSQLGLLGSNTLYAGMVATYPQMTAGSTITTCIWRADFTSGQAEWAGGWQEWSLQNGATADRNLNRKVENLGTGKASELWTAEATITITG